MSSNPSSAESENLVIAARVFAVIVTYRPDRASLDRLLDSLSTQVAGIVVADNGSNGISAGAVNRFPASFAVHLDLSHNFGVAAGLNRGVEIALGLGATHVLLSDQDSEPAADMVARLMESLVVLELSGIKVATVGPRYIDPRSGYAAPFLKTRGLWLGASYGPSPESPVEVDFVITSGSLISALSWQAIGSMFDALFIDYVDIEWGLRGRARGYRSFGIGSAKLAHTLGDRRMNFFGLSVPIHSPLRHYYQIRNPLWLYRKAWIPLNWKFVDGCRLLLRFAFYAIFVAPRVANVKHMWRGLLDGLAGRLGRLE